MEVFEGVKITKTEALRVAAVDLALQLHNWRNDVIVDSTRMIDDAKRIFDYLEQGV